MFRILDKCKKRYMFWFKTNVDGVALWVTTRNSLVTRSRRCLWLLTDTCAADTVITHSVSHSRFSPSRGVWPLSVESSGLALFASCVSTILGHARALRTRMHLALSLVSGLSRLSRRALSRLMARLFLSLDVPLVSPLASPLPSPLRRGSARLHKKNCWITKKSSDIYTHRTTIQNKHFSNTIVNCWLVIYWWK